MSTADQALRFASRAARSTVLVLLASCRGTPTEVSPDSAEPTVATRPVVPGATDGASTAEPSDVAELGTRPVGPTESAIVVRVIDGDTIVVDRGHGEERVRYIGVDTPETVKPGEPVASGGPEASSYNATLVDAQTVVLERDVSDRDRYGRLLRHVWVRDPERPEGMKHVGLLLVQNGHARAVTYRPDVRYAALLSAAERDAGTKRPESRTAPAAGLSSPSTVQDVDAPDVAVSDRDDAGCHPSYRPCLPIVDDLNCPDVRDMGKAPVEVIGHDAYGLDRDHDAVGCE
jgi:micrococcal nuclease